MSFQFKSFVTNVDDLIGTYAYYYRGIIYRHSSKSTVPVNDNNNNLLKKYFIT